MAYLPPELIDRVCSFLSRAELKNTLLVSRAWQYASERASGALAEFELTEENAEGFLSRYSGHRWAYLRHVKFRTRVPVYDQDEHPEDEDDEDEDEEEEEEEEEDGDGGDEEEKSKTPTHRCRESQEELDERDALFTQQINFIFTTLRTLEDRMSPGNWQLTIFTPIQEVRNTVCPHRRCTSWRLHLLHPASLPELNSIRALYVADEFMIDPIGGSVEEGRGQLKLDLRVLVDLAVKLPRLEFLGCRLDAGSPWTTSLRSRAAQHYLRDWDGPHRDSRRDFASALENAKMPASLRQAQLDFMWPLSKAERIDHNVGGLPNLVGAAPQDLFGAGLRILGQQLRKLDLKAVVDGSLFWPASGSGSVSFPHLESISVLFHISAPRGQWYFIGDVEEGDFTDDGHEVTEACYPPLADSDEDAKWDEYIDDHGLDTSTTMCNQYRIKPHDYDLVPFLTSFAKAAAAMPKLKEACLWAPLTWNPSSMRGYRPSEGEQVSNWPDRPLAWGIAYTGPGTQAFHIFPGQNNMDARQLWWTTGSWRPSDELQQLFQQIGAGTNKELIEYWGHEKYGQKLALRKDTFEEFDIFGFRHPDSQWPLKFQDW